MLEDSLKKATEDYVKNIDLSGSSERERKIIRLLLKNKIIDNYLIEKALEEAVFERARKDFKILTSKKLRSRIGYTIFPDYRSEIMSEGFAYALEKGIFSKREIRRINFDHGETAESFVKFYKTETLLSRLREQIFNPKKIKSVSYNEYDYIDPHPVCWCG